MLQCVDEDVFFLIAFPDFFNKNQLDEFISLYKSSLSTKPDSDSYQEIKKLEFEVQDGLNYRSQIDLLVTFSSSRIPKEKFLEKWMEIPSLNTAVMVYGKKQGNGYLKYRLA